MKIKALKGPKRHFKGSKGSSSKIKASKGFKGSLVFSHGMMLLREVFMNQDPKAGI